MKGNGEKWTTEVSEKWKWTLSLSPSVSSSPPAASPHPHRRLSQHHHHQHLISPTPFILGKRLRSEDGGRSTTSTWCLRLLLLAPPPVEYFRHCRLGQISTRCGALRRRRRRHRRWRWRSKGGTSTATISNQWGKRRQPGLEIPSGFWMRNLGSLMEKDEESFCKKDGFW